MANARGTSPSTQPWCPGGRVPGLTPSPPAAHKQLRPPWPSPAPGQQPGHAGFALAPREPVVPFGVRLEMIPNPNKSKHDPQPSMVAAWGDVPPDPSTPVPLPVGL